MASESGDMKLIGNFSQLIELVSLDPNYNPANPALPPPALNTSKMAGTAVVTSLGQADAALTSGLVTPTLPRTTPVLPRTMRGAKSSTLSLNSHEPGQISQGGSALFPC